MRYLVTLTMLLMMLGSFGTGYHYCKSSMVKAIADVTLIRDISTKMDEVDLIKPEQLKDAIDKYYRD